jgi:PAS domain S-box-containing protein
VTRFVRQAVNLNRQHASQIAGFAAATIAVTTVIGWWASLPLLASWGTFEMKPLTALSIAALGVALMHPGKASRIMFAIGLTVMAASALDIGIDIGLVPQAVVPPELGALRSGSRMLLVTAILAGALVLSCFERYHFVAISLSGLGGVIAVFVLLLYLAGIETPQGPVPVRTPGLPTAVSLLCVAGGIVFRIGMTTALRKPRRLWHLLIVLASATIAPLLLLAVYAGLHITGAQLNQARQELMSEAHTLSVEVEHEITGEIQRQQALAASPLLREGDFAAFQRQAETSFASGEGGGIMLIDRNMQRLVDTWRPVGTPMEKAAFQAPVERALATGQPQIGGSFTGPVTRQLVVPGLVVPVQIDGENRYALVRPVDRQALASLVAAYELPPGLQGEIADAAGHIIVRSEQGDAVSGKALLVVRRHCPGPGGAFEFTDADGRPSLGAYACSDRTGWKTTVWKSMALLNALVRALWRTIGLTALLAFSLVSGLALWLSQIVGSSVGQTARAAIALGTGGPLPAEETPVAEVNALMAELRSAAVKRKAAEQDLKASKDHLQLAFDATQLGWWQYDALCRVVSGDERFKEIFDVTAEEVSIEDLIKRVHPDDAESFQANREAALDPANPKPYVHQEYRIRRRDGTVRWVEGNALVHFEGAGVERRLVSFGGTVQDITERKEREEKEHLLMREINHRAKNMLSVVHSIAQQTAATSPEDFVERFSARVQALSANQDLLVRNEWTGVEIADLVGAQLAHFADLIGSRIAVQGSKLRLNPASAQAVGLALHELATNAGKYGALSTDKGRVDISWEVTDGDKFTMSWTECGGPPVTAPKRAGFGTIVMEAMTARSVNGAVQLDFMPSGVMWRLTCLATNALESGGDGKQPFSL